MLEHIHACTCVYACIHKCISIKNTRYSKGEKKKKAAEEIIYGQLPNVNNKGVDYSNSLTLNAEINNVANPDYQRCLSVCQV